MHSTFCVAIEYLGGEKLFLTFGENTPIKDILEVIKEETHDQMTKILGMTFLQNKTKKGLQKQISDWKKHFTSTRKKQSS